MKRLLNYLYILLLLPLMAAMCQKDPGPEPVTGDPCKVSFSARVNEMTTRATDTAFENGDEISVYACHDASLSSSNYAQNVRYSFSDGIFKASSPITYPDKESSLTFYAVYPFGNYSVPEFRFSVSKDQSSELAYTESDLMTASAMAKDKEVVDLKFSHRLAKVVFNLNLGVNASKDQSVTLCKVYTNLDADISGNNFKEKGSKSDVIAAPNGENSFKVILPPQKIAAGTLYARFEIGDKTYDLTADSDIYLSSGVEHIYGVTFKEDSVEITADIIDWNEEHGEVSADRYKK